MTPNLAKAECEPAGYIAGLAAADSLEGLKRQVEGWIELIQVVQPKPGRKYEREMQALKTALTCAKSALDDLTA